jgi:hypothetical protein
LGETHPSECHKERDREDKSLHFTNFNRDSNEVPGASRAGCSSFALLNQMAV